MQSKDAYFVRRCRRTERVSPLLLARSSWMRLNPDHIHWQSDPPVAHNGRRMGEDSYWAGSRHPAPEVAGLP